MQWLSRCNFARPIDTVWLTPKRAHKKVIALQFGQNKAEKDGILNVVIIVTTTLYCSIQTLKEL